VHLEPFLLDRWLSEHQFASPPIRYDLAASAGPAWTFGELLNLGGRAAQQALNALPLSYMPANGGETLRRCIAELHEVDPDCVVVTTGASEALSALFCVSSEPGANVALGKPMFPGMSVMARAWGLGVRSYDLPREQGFEHSPDRILAATDARTRLVVVNSPHNPTGSVMPQQQTAALAAALAERKIALMSTRSITRCTSMPRLRLRPGLPTPSSSATCLRPFH
jgi:DNA-binding transcriptional MocR family regulator